MYLQNAKKKHKCTFCPNDIERGEVFCIVPSTKKGQDTPWLAMFHYDCYIPFLQKKLQEKYDTFVGKGIVRPKYTGRPLKPCLDRREKRRLQSLRCYHLHAGHLEKAMDIARAIRMLETTVEMPRQDIDVASTVKIGEGGKSA